MILSKIFEQQRIPTMELSKEIRKKIWLNKFIKSYLVVFIGYLSMYMIRKNFNIAQNDMIQDYGLSFTDLGLIGLGFSITYGLGKTMTTYYFDGKNTKQVLPFMLILSAICMIGFGLSLGSSTYSIFLMIAFYAMSGFFQSPGGSCSYSTITKWTPRNRRGFFLGLWNMSHNIGGALAAAVALFGAHVVFDGNVVGMFIFPSVLCLIIGFIGLRVGNDSPESYGLGPVEEIFDEPISEEDAYVKKVQISKWEIFKKYVVFNKIIWVLCFANVFLYVVRIGVDQWSPVYAHEVLGFTKETSAWSYALFESGALTGTLLWGLLSDLINGRRGLTAIICLIATIILIFLYQSATNQYVYLTVMFLLGFCVFGPQLLIGVAAVGFVPKQGIAVADGIKGTFAYLLGDSFAKLGLGMIADKKISLFGFDGWYGTFIALYLAAIVCFVLMMFVAIAEEKKIKRNKEYYSKA
ncbi:hexose-6-phosphate:phosphate antiporter [Francisella marina]|uniref:Hexose-6-phosphate:phosphate antiporter n=2 Tax=Francisella marina TaxID=2249302 RepID=A0ABX5ZH80_9GAMM|nr:hexose-6-phosphate:phosphate antiporter [Francisella marina]QEO57811.1 hexose-6-phosphate:phosphate antiporter [Francisella marina]QEO59962.1 hexose-6-phosphate:phosphate antiporter [Francisella marina]